MKNKLKLVLLTGLLTLSAMNCHTTERDDLSNQTSENLRSEISNKSKFASQNINIERGDKKYELLEDNSAAYFIKGKYQGDIVVDNKNLEISDNRESTGEIKVINTLTNESMTFSNIIEENGKTFLDVTASNGNVIKNLLIYETIGENSNKNPIIRLAIKAVVSIVTVVVVATSSGGTQQECAASMPKNCSGGTNPYSTYSSGWFNSTCEVGCR